MNLYYQGYLVKEKFCIFLQNFNFLYLCIPVYSSADEDNTLRCLCQEYSHTIIRSLIGRPPPYLQVAQLRRNQLPDNQV
jgi:hypothetical protein